VRRIWRTFALQGAIRFLYFGTASHLHRSPSCGKVTADALFVSMPSVQLDFCLC
jgi:hypothetical protein